MKREAVIRHQQEVIAGRRDAGDERELQAELARIDDDFEFIAECNLGGEFMADERIERLQQIAERTYSRTLDNRLGVAQEELRRMQSTPPESLPVQEKVLQDRPDHIHEHDTEVYSADPDNPYGFRMEVPKHKYNKGEVYNLSIGRGTLTDEERFKINDHIMQTLIMLSTLPFPRALRDVPQLAATHHEKLDGTGYPRRLGEDQLSVPDRVLAIADIFEALTAADRPYKPAKTLSEAVRIMLFMAKDRHIDGELLALFLRTGVHEQYGQLFLQPQQCDQVDVEGCLAQLREWHVIA